MLVFNTTCGASCPVRVGDLLPCEYVGQSGLVLDFVHHFPSYRIFDTFYSNVFCPLHPLCIYIHLRVSMCRYTLNEICHASSVEIVSNTFVAYRHIVSCRTRFRSDIRCPISDSSSSGTSRKRITAQAGWSGRCYHLM